VPRRTTAVLITLSLVLAAASPAAGQGLLEHAVDYISPEAPYNLINDIDAYIRDLGVASALSSVGGAILTGLFILSLYRGIAAGNTGIITNAVVRAIVAGGLLSVCCETSPFSGQLEPQRGHFTVAGLVRLAVDEVRSVSGRIWEDKVARPLRENLPKLSAALSSSWIISMIIASIGGNLLADWVGLDAAAQLLTGVITAGMRLILVLLGGFFAIAAGFQFVAYGLAYVATLWTPIAFAGIAHPMTEDWVGRWVKHVVHAVVLLLFVNVIMAIAVNVAIVQPVTRWANELSTIVDRAQAGGVSIETAKAMGNIFLDIFLFPISLVIGLLFGTFLIWQTERWVAGLIGATASMLPGMVGALGWQLGHLLGRPRMPRPAAAGGGPGGGGAAAGPTGGGGGQTTTQPQGDLSRPALPAPHALGPPAGGQRQGFFATVVNRVGSFFDRTPSGRVRGGPTPTSQTGPAWIPSEPQIIGRSVDTGTAAQMTRSWEYRPATWREFGGAPPEFGREGIGRYYERAYQWQRGETNGPVVEYTTPGGGKAWIRQGVDSVTVFYQEPGGPRRTVTYGADGQYHTMDSSTPTQTGQGLWKGQDVQH